MTVRTVETQNPRSSGGFGIIGGAKHVAPGETAISRGLTSKGESPMPPHDTPYPTHRKNDRRVIRMYERYCEGMSLAAVAAEFGVTRQSVYKMFLRRGMPMRPKPERRSTVEFNGEFYSMRDCGYYGKTRGDRSLLHRDVWEFHYGPIPDGHDVHHVDEDRTHNDIDNLECLPKDEHTRLHYRRQRDR